MSDRWLLQTTGECLRIILCQTLIIYYNMVRFWGHKPYEIVNVYIRHCTDENDVNLFSGNGVAALEASQPGRWGVYFRQHLSMIWLMSLTAVLSGAERYLIHQPSSLSFFTKTIELKHIGPNSPSKNQVRCPAIFLSPTFLKNTTNSSRFSVSSEPSPFTCYSSHLRR